MKQKIALFDFDDTLIHGDSIIYLLRYYIKRHPLSIFRFILIGWYFIEFRVFKTSIHKAKSAALFPIVNMSDEELQIFFKEQVEPKYYSHVVEELKQKKEQGYRVYIISASVEAYLRFCDLPADCIMGTKLEIRNGKYINTMIGENCKNEEKVRRIQDDLRSRGIEIDYDNSYGYSDSEHDIPMLKLVKNRIRINRSNGEMSPFIIRE